MATRAVSHSRPAGRARRRPAARGAVLRRRVVAGVILIVALYAGYMFWFRDLSWFAIHDVTIDGATTNEREIKSAVETIFQVKVDHVRTINFMGKLARRGRFEGRKPSWKKAYVTLKQGEKPVDYGEAI